MLCVQNVMHTTFAQYKISAISGQSLASASGSSPNWIALAPGPRSNYVGQRRMRFSFREQNTIHRNLGVCPLELGAEMHRVETPLGAFFGFVIDFADRAAPRCLELIVCAVGAEAVAKGLRPSPVSVQGNHSNPRGLKPNPQMTRPRLKTAYNPLLLSSL